MYQAVASCRKTVLAFRRIDRRNIPKKTTVIRLFSCPLGAEAILCKTDAEKTARTRFSRAAARRTPWLTRLPAPGPVKNPVESQSRKRGALYAHSHGH
jgi:hypothetical protein